MAGVDDAADTLFASVQHTTGGHPYFSFDAEDGAEPPPVLVRTFVGPKPLVLRHMPVLADQGPCNALLCHSMPATVQPQLSAQPNGSSHAATTALDG